MKKALLEKTDPTPQPRSQTLCDGDYGCYVEEYFHELIAFERKRSERSGRPFLVMTLDFTRISNLQKRHEAVKGAMQALLMLSRDTDIKGWYDCGSVLGVIFTEMNSLETDTLQKKIRQESRCKVIAHNSPTTRQALQKCHRFDNVENTEDTKGCYYVSNLVRQRKQRQNHPDDFIDDNGTVILYAEPLFSVARRRHT